LGLCVEKFSVASFGCIFLGVFTESIGLIRRLARRALAADPALLRLQVLPMAVLYAIQLMLGYFCMLVAMTYQVELFVCVVVGLALGHALFNFKPLVVAPQDSNAAADASMKNPIQDSVDPCCEYLHMDDDSEHSIGLSGGAVASGANKGLIRKN
jgi:hypothetical protein